MKFITRIDNCARRREVENGGKKRKNNHKILSNDVNR